MKHIKIRESAFDNLWSYVLNVNFTYKDWEMFGTDDDSLNPLVIFKTRKWDKLVDSIQSFVIAHKPEQYTDKTSEMDLICGSFQEIINLINAEVK